MLGFSEFISQIGWGGVFIFTQIALAICLLIYVTRLRHTAQIAAFFALPRRRVLEKHRFGRVLLQFFSPAHPDTEHLIGKIDLADFRPAEIEANPVAKGVWISRLMKRGFDIIMALSLLIFTFPVLVACAVAVKVSSPGPVFYKQIRVGRHGKHFSILKFRSMIKDAEKDGARWAAPADERITKVGAFLRRSRLDEIPQVINILRGEMSFVGPRPERPEFTQMLVKHLPHYNERHLMKPGLTGWAQVNSPYGASVEDSRDKLTYDLYYVKNFSLILDLFIIIKTVRVALFGVGAR